MEKGTLLDRLNVTGEDRLLLSRVLDRLRQSQSRKAPVATDFLSPREQALSVTLLHMAGTPEASYLFTGGAEGAERRIILFLPDWLSKEDAPASGEVPLRALRASYRTEDGLSHRDLLGSLMGLGIVREKVGDIHVGADSADVVVLDSVSDFLLQNWTAAGRAGLRVGEIPLTELRIPPARFQETRSTVSSLRLDAVLSAALHLSRGRAAELITAGRVQVNWFDCAKPDRLLSAGDTVTARGFGRVELADVGGLTRKGRISVTLRRYV